MGRQAGIRVGDGELNQAFENIAQVNGLSLEEFIKTLETEGESYEDLQITSQERNDYSKSAKRQSGKRSKYH